MKKFIPLLLLLLTSITKAQIPPPIKVFTSENSVQIGIYLECHLGELSTVTTPNIIIEQTQNHFEIILSLSGPTDIICTPPPGDTDQYRDYFNLGVLPSGEYTISVDYVLQNESIPPKTGIIVYNLYETGFSIPHSVTATNKTALIIMILLFGFLALIYFRSVRKFN